MWSVAKCVVVDGMFLKDSVCDVLNRANRQVVMAFVVEFEVNIEVCAKFAIDKKDIFWEGRLGFYMLKKGFCVINQFFAKIDRLFF